MKKMHHTLLSSLCVAAAALAGAGVQAQGSGSSSIYNLYGRGTSHIGFNAGLTDYKLNDGTGLFGSDNNSTAYNIYVGSYFTDSNIGMELGYTDFGTVNRAGGSTSADGINLSVIGRLPMGETFSLLGKVGGTYARTDVSAAAGSGVTGGSESGFDWSYGVGAELAFSRQWSGVLQYDEHRVTYAGNVDDRIKVTSLGVRYRY